MRFVSAQLQQTRTPSESRQVYLREVILSDQMRAHLWQVNAVRERSWIPRKFSGESMLISIGKNPHLFRALQTRAEIGFSVRRCFCSSLKWTIVGVHAQLTTGQ